MWTLLRKLICVPCIPCPVNVGASAHNPCCVGCGCGCGCGCGYGFRVQCLGSRVSGLAYVVCTMHTMCCRCWCIDPQPMLCVWNVRHTYHVLWVLVHRPTAHNVCVACVPYMPCAVGVGASTHSPCCAVCVACVPYIPCAMDVGASTHSPCCVCGMCAIHTMCCWCWCIDPQPMLCVWHVCHT